MLQITRGLSVFALTASLAACADNGSGLNDAMYGATSGTAGSGAGAGAGTGADVSNAGTSATSTVDGSIGQAGTESQAGEGSDPDATDAVVEDAAPADASSDKRRPPCTTKASQVVLLGDSYMNWVSHTFADDMAKAAGEKWRLHAVGGYSMGSGGIGLIPPLFEDAVTEDPDIQAVVMTGGGNDVLVADGKWQGGADCRQRADSPTLKVCQDIVQTAIDAAQKLMLRSADAGVKDVVYFFYPHVPEGTLVGGAHPTAILDYALPKVQKLCEDAVTVTGGRLHCHFLNTIPLFEGHPELFAPTDIHENAMGSKVIADAIWKIMQNECVAQDASSGCCEP